WSMANAGEMAAGPASGTRVLKVAPLSVDTCSPLVPAANRRRATGKLGARSIVPPENPDAFRRSHVVPPSTEWKSTGHAADTQLLSLVPLPSLLYCVAVPLR